MYGGCFDTKEECEKYKEEHEHKNMIATYLQCVKKWALVFPLKLNTEIDD